MDIGSIVGRLILQDNFTDVLDKARVDLTRTSRDMEAVGRKISSIGTLATYSLTLPLAAAGAAAFKFSSDFSLAMAKIEILAGVPKEAIAGLKTEIENLAERTGNAPKELADSFYFLASSGLTVSEAMEGLKSSAEGAAIGLGTAQEVGRLLTYVMNAYGPSVMTAAHATNILAAAVRVGTFETNELAPVLGRVIPLASAMGVRFEDMAGALAVMSRTGLSAFESATSMLQVLTGLLKPTPKAAEALRAVGLEFEDLQKMVAKPGGFLEMLNLVNQKTEDLGTKALAKIFPNVRAFRGVMNVLAQDNEKVAKAFDQVANSGDIVGEGMKRLSTELGFKLKQFVAGSQDAFIKLGDALVPVFQAILDNGLKLTQWAAGAAKTFQGMSPAMQQSILALVGFAAALGPVLKLGGNLIALGAGLNKIWGVMALALGPVGLALLAVAAAAAAAAIAFKNMANSMQKDIEATVKAGNTATDAYKALIEVRKQMAAQGGKGTADLFLPQAQIDAMKARSEELHRITEKLQKDLQQAEQGVRVPGNARMGGGIVKGTPQDIAKIKTELAKASTEAAKFDKALARVKVNPAVKSDLAEVQDTLHLTGFDAEDAAAEMKKLNTEFEQLVGGTQTDRERLVAAIARLTELMHKGVGDFSAGAVALARMNAELKEMDTFKFPEVPNMFDEFKERSNREIIDLQETVFSAGLGRSLTGAELEEFIKKQREVEFHNDQINQGLESWAAFLHRGLPGVSQQINDVARGIARMADGMLDFRDAANDAGKKAAGLAGIAEGFADIAGSLGLFGKNVTMGGFGARGEGNYAGVSSAVGSIIGGIIGGILGAGAFSAAGAQAGMAIGGAVGGAVGSFIKKGADEAVGSLKFDFTGFREILAVNEGNLGKVLTDLGQSIERTFFGLIEQIGATVEGLPQIDFKVRDGIIGVVVGAVKAKFNDMDDAIGFAVTELLKQGQFTGMSDAMRKVLENTKAIDLGDLGEDIKFGQWYERLGLADVATNILDALTKFRTDMRKATELGLDTQPIVDNFREQFAKMRDQILGITKTPQEQLRANVDAFNQQVKLTLAEQQIRHADLMFKKADLAAQLQLALAKSKLTQEEFELKRRELEFQGAVIEAEISTLSALFGALQAVDQALLVTEGILSSLEGMLISEQEFQDALKRLGGGKGVGKGKKKDIMEQIDDILKDTGLTGAAKEYEDIIKKYDEWTKAVKLNKEEMDKLAAARQKEIDLLREKTREEYKQYLGGYGQSDFAMGITDFFKQLEAIPRAVMPNWMKELIEGRFLEEQGQELQDRIKQFGGDFFPTAEIDEVRASANQLRADLAALAAKGVDVSQQLKDVGDAEQYRLDQIGMGILDKLYGYLKDDKRFDAQYREFQKKRIDLDFKMIEAQLKALNMWDAATIALFNAAHEAANALEGAADAANNIWADTQRLLQERLERERQDAIQEAERLRDLWASIIQKLTQFRDSLFTNVNLSPLSAADRLATAQAQFQAAVAAAIAGDAESAQQVQGLAQTLLDQARAFFAGGQGYDALFAAVVAALNQVIGYGSGISGTGTSPVPGTPAPGPGGTVTPGTTPTYTVSDVYNLTVEANRDRKTLVQIGWLQVSELTEIKSSLLRTELREGMVA